jgi:hypothetical protein
MVEIDVWQGLDDGGMMIRRRTSVELWIEWACSGVHVLFAALIISCYPISFTDIHPLAYTYFVVRWDIGKEMS